MSNPVPTSKSLRPFRFTKKNLYDLMPAIYRERDVETGSQLEALMGVIAEQVRVVESNMNSLYQDWFIETCDQWVVPYIGDLLASRLLNENVAGGAIPERAFVANTISYRRRKGTVSMLEELAANVTGWPAKVVEFFELLETTQYLNHLRPANLRTPDIRDQNTLELFGTPFDSIAHTVEVRHINDEWGRYNIQDIGIFLYRLTAFPVENAPAFAVPGRNGCFEFNALGLDGPLFNKPVPKTNEFQLAQETNVPVAIRRTAFLDDPTAYYASGGEEKSIKVTADHQVVSSDSVVSADLSAWWRPPNGQVAIDPVLGRLSFPLGSSPAYVHVSYHYGFSDEVGGGFYQRPDPDAPQSAQVYQVKQNGPTGPFQFNTISAAVAQWRNVDGQPSAIFEVQDSEAYLEGPISFSLPVGVKVELRAAELQRPILRMPVLVSAGAAPQDPPLTSLFLNGMLFDVNSQIPAVYVQPGDLGALTLRHCTISPLRGPSLALAVSPSGGTTNDSLTITIDHSITGGISVDPSVSQAQLRIQDSVVDGKYGTVAAGSLSVASPGFGKAHSIGEPVTLTASTTTTAKSNPGQTYLKVSSTSAFIQGGLVSINAGQPNEEFGVVYPAPVTNTSLPLAAGLYYPHAATEPVALALSTAVTMPSNKGDDLLHVSGVAGLTAGAPVTVDSGGANAETVTVASVFPGETGVALNSYQLTIEESTVLGGTQTFMVGLASNTIFTEAILSTRRQVGCVRYCFLPPGSRVPRPYKCQPQYPDGSTFAQEEALALLAQPTFTSIEYGDPGYAQLSSDCPSVVFRGADNGAEMGVFNELLQALRIDNLNALVSEYLRFGLEAGIFPVT
jgi:hypothetical protein